MAAPSIAFGLKATRHLNGGQLRPPRIFRGALAQGYATTLKEGDPLQFLVTGGNAGTYALSDGTVVDAIFSGVEWTDADGRIHKDTVWIGGTVSTGDINVDVYDDIGCEFEVAVDTAAVPTLASRGKGALLTIAAGPNPRLSGVYLGTPGAQAVNLSAVTVNGITTGPDGAVIARVVLVKRPAVI